MLVFNMQASFNKKAVGKINFVCNDGNLIKQSVEKAIATGDGVTCETVSKGYDVDSNCVAEFRIVWTFKQKQGMLYTPECFLWDLFYYNKFILPASRI